MKLVVGIVSIVVSAFGAWATLAADNVEIVGSFPKTNQFGIVYNGEPNQLILKVSNLGKDALDVVNLRSAHSEFRELGGKERVLRKNKATPLKGSIPAGQAPAVFPYIFSSELKEGNVNLRVWVDWTSSKGVKERTLAYDSTVTISEPPTRWFDPQLFLLYLILVGGSGLASLGLYRSFVSSPIKRGNRPGLGKLPSGFEGSVVEKVMTPGGGAYEQDWIPKGHLKSSKVVIGGGSGGVDSGGETSGTEGKVRRRKR